MKVVLKENGRAYEAVRALSMNGEPNYLNTRTNTIRIKNEYGKETFVYPKEIDWEATKKLNKEQQEEQNNG